MYLIFDKIATEAYIVCLSSQQSPRVKYAEMNRYPTRLPAGLLTMFCSVAAAVWNVTANSVNSSALPVEPFALHETFEEFDPVRFWKGEGAFTVGYKGLSDEAARQGARSFKLDVRFEEDSECFWLVPHGVPADGTLHVSLFMRAGDGTTADEMALGYGLQYIPSDEFYRREFRTIRGAEVMGEATEWLSGSDPFMTPGHPNDTIMSEARFGNVGWSIIGVESADVGLVAHTVIRLKGRAGQRAVLYLDDVRLEGTSSNPDAYRDAVAARYDRASVRLRRQLMNWQGRLKVSRKKLMAAEALPVGLRSCREALQRAAMKEILNAGTLLEDGTSDRQELDRIMDTLWGLEQSVAGVHALSALEGTPDLVHYTVRPISNTPVLPSGPPTVGGMGVGLSMAACPGEIEPVSFAVHALADLSSLQVEPGDLTGPGTISAGSIDPYLVKVWHQAGFYMGDPHTRMRPLVPELLLKDDALVRVDFETRQNYLRHSAADGTTAYRLCSGPSIENLEDVQPRDADTLQPVDVRAGMTQQYWLTLRVPDDAEPGEYAGTVTLRYGPDQEYQIPIQLTVYPFELPPSPLTYSTFNRGRVAGEAAEPTINTEYLTLEVYEREIRNQVEHGILHPNSYDGFERLRPALEARRRAGVATDRFFSVDLAYLVRESAAGKEGFLERLTEAIGQWKAVLEEFGYEELWVMGIDEARGAKLESQVHVIDAVHRAGAKFWAAATHVSTFDVVGDRMDLCIMAGYPRREEAKQWHSAGHQIFCYGFPQTDFEQPEVYRRNYGLYLWRAGYDGAMLYAYRHGFEHVWNDFDYLPRRRDHTLVYPTANGLINTLAWEGMREAVDDVRYMAALQNAIGNAEGSEIATRALMVVNALDLDGPLDEARATIVESILDLMR
jgi:hypothetical protein